MIYTIRCGACPTCKHRYHANEEEESPCHNCCHNFDDKYEKDRGDNDDG